MRRCRTTTPRCDACATTVDVRKPDRVEEIVDTVEEGLDPPPSNWSRRI
jgi:hypothetical protein